MRNDNKGLTLVELLIVVVMSTILLGVIGYSISLITGKEAQQCANNISVALDKAKNYAMTKSGKADAYIKISYDPSSGYHATYYVPDNVASSTADVVIEEEKIGRKSVKVVCDGGGEITAGNSLIISYDRINGGIKEASINGATCKSITIQKGRNYKITLYSITGKHTLERIS